MNINPYFTNGGIEISPVVTSTGDIAFDANLIARLEGDHAGLIATLEQLHSTAAAQPRRVITDLILLRELFQEHLMMEETYFYAYLDRLLAGNTTIHDSAQAMRNDMEEIATTVAQFIHSWISTPPTDATSPVFLDQLRCTMKLLKARVEREETTLYPLYKRAL